jgi:lycopene cyclase domain-containing protein
LLFNLHSNYTYLLLDAAVLFFPLILSFDKKVAFYTTWKALFISILIVGLGFIAWDVLFTHYQVWQFNRDYVLGIYIAGLPIEEWLFFIIVPYACVFIYECIRIYFKRYLPEGITKIISVLLILINAGMLVTGYDKTYTLVNSMICLLVLIFFQYVIKWEKLNLFYLVYLICLLPFAVCNGILTSLPILIYDDGRNLAIRAGTIPVEDFFYNFSMLVLWCFFYEKFRWVNKTRIGVDT